MWTHFWDMNSGGGSKEPQGHIYIEADKEQAKVIFYNRFGHNPDRVTCTCCGNDYDISSGESLEDLTGYLRGCRSAYLDSDGSEVDFYSATREQRKDLKHHYIEVTGATPLDQYLKSDDVLVIRAADIDPRWREGHVPEQGYVWVD